MKATYDVLVNTDLVRDFAISFSHHLDSFIQQALQLFLVELGAQAVLLLRCIGVIKVLFMPPLAENHGYYPVRDIRRYEACVDVALCPFPHDIDGNLLSVKIKQHSLHVQNTGM